MLRRKGLVTNKKRTYRLYTELGMQVRAEKRKKLIRPRVPMDMPLQPNERWTLDFVSDQLSHRRCISVLNIADDYSWACVGQLVNTSISGQRKANDLCLSSQESPIKTPTVRNSTVSSETIVWANTGSET